MSKSPARILIVDDSDDNLYLMSALLADSYEVVTASGGLQALQIARSAQPPDLILLDILMPDMDGYEVLRRLKADPCSAGIPVIFLTALTSVPQEQLGLDLGAVDYITKPISPPVLLARTKSHLERSVNARQLEALSAQLGRYLAPQVVQSLLDGSQQAEIRAQRKKLTVFFSDIKDFTVATARWEPEDVRFMLNSYFSEMSKVVDEYGGTLDKFIGDAMMVFFGDPHSRGPKEDALQCVRMALAMQRRMDRLCRQWQAMGNRKAFQIRCGINTGYCDVGNFGSDRRMDYTIIGPEVNLAARLEKAAAPGSVLISHSTWQLVSGAIEALEQPPIAAKGFAQPVRAHAVLGEAQAFFAPTQPGALDMEVPMNANWFAPTDLGELRPGGVRSDRLQ
ncbi:adenylate/guanylate cyclase domain-containing protein [Ramlibacter tataouinensis]|uniref:Candidate response regulator, CyC-C n=1 Tax=Ramlibacter tataouinensis (strain ATCC BAA-407 / DSM 14655 / LMG 21543 / TTB310) TaxID=365046 RepID=F5Y2R4_RAMTT|nr:adenylate/guanylate cyclase domain-containing protein [Ramlibacter tataouinensis]AEG93610.1 candidate response regulator, CyC-C [Ramlibacter tataouinensis TTB310]